MEKKYISIGKETIAYLDEGTGPAVVMVHGNMSSSVHYEPLISRIKDSYRCIALDLRGFGDSTYNERFDTLEELADDVNLFTEALGLDSYYLVGWSNGGGVSLKLCAKHPHKVKKFFDIEGAGLKGYPVFKKENFQSTGEPCAPGQGGAIDHISLDVDDIEATWAAVKEAGYTPVEAEIDGLPYFEKGVRFFNIVGPNAETIEFCQIL